jgi:hypothetical protein
MASDGTLFIDVTLRRVTYHKWITFSGPNENIPPKQFWSEFFFGGGGGTGI